MNKHIRICDWFLSKISGDNYSLTFANSVVKEVTDEMWNDLKTGIKKWNIKIISCQCAFQYTNIRSFTIPSQYEYMFDEITYVNYMFADSKIEVLDIKFKSTKLKHAEYMCRNCSRLEKANVSTYSNITLVGAFNGCHTLKTLNLTCNDHVNINCMLNRCGISSPIINIKSKKIIEHAMIQSAILNTGGNVIYYTDHEGYPYKISSKCHKYCQSLLGLSFMFDCNHIVSIKYHSNDEFSRSKSLIV